MHSARPKVLHRLGGRPMLRHVVDTAAALNPQDLCVVYGDAAVRDLPALPSQLRWVHQGNSAANARAAVDLAVPRSPLMRTPPICGLMALSTNARFIRS